MYEIPDVTVEEEEPGISWVLSVKGGLAAFNRYSGKRRFKRDGHSFIRYVPKDNIPKSGAPSPLTERFTTIEEVVKSIKKHWQRKLEWQRGSRKKS